MDALAASDSTDCIIDHNSYSINATSGAVSMNSSGILTVDTSLAIPPTSYVVTVIVGSQTSESPIFSMEVFESNFTFNMAPLFE